MITEHPTPSDSSNKVTVPVGVSQFFNPARYQTFLDQAISDENGPSNIVATELYLEALYGNELEDFKSILGDALWHAIVVALSVEFQRILVQFDAPVEVRQRVTVLPTLIMILAQTLEMACRLVDQEVVCLVHEAYHALAEAAEDEGLDVYYSAFHRVIEAMDTVADGDEPMDQGMPVDAFERGLRGQLRQLRSLQQRMGVSLETVKRAMGMASPTSSVKAPMALPKEEDHSIIQQLDDTTAPNAASELNMLFEPTRPRQKNSEAQWEDTLAHLEEPYRQAIELRRKVSGNTVESVRCMEAWAMHSVGRILMRLYTPEQMKLLMDRLPIESVVEAIMVFVMEYQGKAPDISWPQMRVSFTASSMSVMTTPDHLVAFASALYEEMGLQSEVSLLSATLAMHFQALTQSSPPLKAPGLTH